MIFGAAAAATVGAAHFTTDVVAGWCVGIAWVPLLAVVLRVWLGQPDTLPETEGARGERRRERTRRFDLAVNPHSRLRRSAGSSLADFPPFG
jgi:membrane-associated phospholipid phosphatase